MKKYHLILRPLALALIAASAACGVKGPPLPPVADTPQASDRTNEPNTPRPSPTPSKTPSTKKKGTSTGR